MNFPVILLCFAPIIALSQGTDDWKWKERSSTNAPSPREGAGIVWTGREILVSHGYDGDEKGGRYDPGRNIWSSMSTNNAPLKRAYHTVVWTGKRLIVWGGFGTRRSTGRTEPLNDGGIYDPETDTWKTIPPDEALSRRYFHAAAWTGSEMIIWGGSDPDRLGDGARYNPETGIWTPMSMCDAPSGRSLAGAVWTGREFIVWGGDFRVGPTQAGGRYDPVTDSWKPTSLVGAPAPRADFACVWTGTEMLVWGGGVEGGGCYNPVTDTWRAMNTNGMPPARGYHSAVWSGRELIVWGGQTAPSNLHNDGGRYDPVTDIWLSTTTEGAPAGRSAHVAVWIGDAMLCFGGWTGGEFYVNDLWSYQPPDVFSGDGLPDEWQHEYFGTTWTADALLEADIDADDQPNYYEFVAGTNPTNSASRFAFNIGIDDSSRPQLTLSGLSLDRIVSVHWTTNLANPIFQPLTNFQVATQDQSIIVTDIDGLSAMRFYNVQLQR